MLYLNRFELFTMYLCDNWPHVKNNFSLELQGNIFWSLTFCIGVVFYKTGCCQGESFFKLSKVLHRVFYNTSKALLFSNREIESSCKNKHTYVYYYNLKIKKSSGWPKNLEFRTKVIKNLEKSWNFKLFSNVIFCHRNRVANKIFNFAHL